MESIKRPDGVDHLLHHVPVRVISIGVVGRVAGDLVVVLVLVLPQQDVVAVLGRGEGGRHEEGHEAMLGQLELVDDLRAEQAQGIGERGETETRMELLGDGGAADQMPALQDQRAQSCLGQIGAVHQAVVTASDHDRVEFLLGRHIYLRLSFWGG